MMNAVACSQAVVVVSSHRQHGLSSAPAVCLASRPHIRASRVSLRQQWNLSVTTPLVARPVRHVGAAVVLCRALSSQQASLPTAPAASMVPYYAAFLVFGCAVNTIGPMLPALAAHVGLTPVDMAPLLSAKGAAGLAGSFLCPLLPLSLLLPGGLLSIGVAFAAIPMVSSLTQLIIVYCFAAAVYQAVSVAAHTLIAQQHGDRAGPHLNGINALFGAGSLLAPALHRVASPSVAHYGPLASYWFIAAAACMAALPFLSAATRSTASASSASSHSADDDSPIMWTARTLIVVALAMALVACNVGAENCFGTWLYTYVLGTTGSGPASSSVSLFWGSFTAGRLLAIPISASIAPGTILLASLPLAIAGPCIILLGARVGTVALLYAGAMAAGLGISTGFANSVSLLSRYVPPTGTVQAAIQVAATLGSMTFPPAVALIAQRGVFGVEAFLYVASALAALDVLLVLLLQGAGRPRAANVPVAAM